MKRNLLFICSIFISSCITLVQAEEKFYISKEEISNKVKALAILPTENIIYETVNDAYANSYDFQRLAGYGIFNPKGFLILKDKIFVDSIALITDALVYHKLDDSKKYSLINALDMSGKKDVVLILMKIPTESNPVTTIKKTINKKDFIKNLFDSLSADAVLCISYQMTTAELNNSIAKWDSYSENYDISATGKWDGNTPAFSMVGIMFGREGDTLWTGRYGMRVLNRRTTGENIFEDDRIKEATKKIFKKLLK